MSAPDEASISDLFDAQIQQQGVACVRVQDGQVFMFTLATLRQLLDRAEQSESGRVTLFVQTGAVQ